MLFFYEPGMEIEMAGYFVETMHLVILKWILRKERAPAIPLYDVTPSIIGQGFFITCHSLTFCCFYK
jgi:hypothetical protein